jgi:pyrimidine-nucleoside phosphorylase/thymidine phosphorylase
MRPVDVIRRKRDGEELSPDAIRALIAGLMSGEIPTYQAAAWLMAVYFRGLGRAELAALTDAMLHSGEVMDLSSIAAVKVDKHSTGGVGDKISLCLAPAVAACGVAVPMISGRGLGHTGGTLDKLESIPGFKVDLAPARFLEVVREHGLALIGQTATVVPADRLLYGLRDVTATVESIPLIASSIMSKKLAEGIDALVLDVKFGAGAFMKTLKDARALAEVLVAIGADAGKRVTALVTAMDQPIGRAVGNASEMREAIEVLKGSGPEDTRALTVKLGGEMLVLGGAAADAAAGEERIAEALASGAGLDRLRRVVIAQGGDVRVIDDPSLLPQPRARVEVPAPVGGIVQTIDAEKIGRAAMVLGAGRRKAEDDVDATAGIEVLHKVGDHVREGSPLCVLELGDAAGVADARALALEAYTIADAVPRRAPLVAAVIRSHEPGSPPEAATA